MQTSRTLWKSAGVSQCKTHLWLFVQHKYNHDSINWYYPLGPTNSFSLLLYRINGKTINEAIIMIEIRLIENSYPNDKFRSIHISSWYNSVSQKCRYLLTVRNWIYIEAIIGYIPETKREETLVTISTTDRAIERHKSRISWRLNNLSNIPRCIWCVVWKPEKHPINLHKLFSQTNKSDLFIHYTCMCVDVDADDSSLLTSHFACNNRDKLHRKKNTQKLSSVSRKLICV
jgi:hypothetical protein